MRGKRNAKPRQMENLFGMFRNAGPMKRAWRSALKATGMGLALEAAALGGEESDVPRFAAPMDELRQTSSFGENRGLRLHAGLDFGVNGKIGLPVRAVDDGRVVRIKASRDGYGLALYVEHRSGLVSVYAHLDGLEEEGLGLQTLLRKGRAETEKYFPGDIFPEPAPEVRRGQVIAYSGDSGDGPPHLHFEMRRGMDEAVAPLPEGFSWPMNSSAPVIEALRLEPRSEDAHIEGVPLGRWIPLDGKAAEPLRLWGEWDIVAEGYSPCGDSGRCGWSAWSAELDGKRFFAAEPRRFSYLEPPWGGWLFHLFHSAFHKGSFACRVERLPSWAAGVDKARPLAIRSEKGHILTFRASSENGLEVRKTLLFRGVPPDKIAGPVSSGGDSAPAAWTVHSFAWGLTVEMEPAAPWALRLRDVHGNFSHERRAWPAGGKAWASMEISGEDAPLVLELLNPATGEVLAAKTLSFLSLRPGHSVQGTAGPSLLLRADADAVFTNMLLWHEALEPEAALPPGFSGKAFFRMRPQGLAFRKKIQLEYAIPSGVEAPQHWGIYARDFASGQWKFAGSWLEGNTLRAGLAWACDFAVLEDMAPPALKAGLPAPEQKIGADRRRFHAMASDAESGLDAESVEFRIDGKVFRGELHPSRGQAFLDMDFHGVALTAGRHRLEASVLDRAGNRGELEPLEFEVEAPVLNGEPLQEGGGAQKEP
jgi:murein DD-endopeptidase MepM/ murein hydrolase activator NlpD